MNFLSKLLQGITFAPAIIQGVERLFGSQKRRDQESRGTVFRELRRLGTDGSQARTSSIPTSSRTDSAK